MVGHSFKVTVYDGRRERLVAELAAYYAPVPCESAPNFADQDERTQRKDIQRERRARWQKRQYSDLWQVEV